MPNYSNVQTNRGAAGGTNQPAGCPSGGIVHTRANTDRSKPPTVKQKFRLAICTGTLSVEQATHTREPPAANGVDAKAKEGSPLRLFVGTRTRTDRTAHILQARGTQAPRPRKRPTIGWSPPPPKRPSARGSIQGGLRRHPHGSRLPTFVCFQFVNLVLSVSASALVSRHVARSIASQRCTARPVR